MFLGVNESLIRLAPASGDRSDTGVPSQLNCSSGIPASGAMSKTCEFIQDRRESRIPLSGARSEI